MTAAGAKKYYSVREAAIQIERSENSLRKLIKKEYIKVCRARDNSIRIEAGELQAFIRGEEGPTPQVS